LYGLSQIGKLPLSDFEWLPKYHISSFSIDDVDLDSYNKFILVQLLEKLNDEMSQFHFSITHELSGIFKEYDQVNSSDKPTFDLINKNIDIAFRLTMWEDVQIQKRIDFMIQLSRKIEDNENYHHLAKRNNQKLVFFQARFFVGFVFIFLKLIL